MSKYKGEYRCVLKAVSNETIHEYTERQPDGRNYTYRRTERHNTKGTVIQWQSVHRNVKGAYGINLPLWLPDVPCWLYPHLENAHIAKQIAKAKKAHGKNQENSQDAEWPKAHGTGQRPSKRP